MSNEEQNGNFAKPMLGAGVGKYKTIVADPPRKYGKWGKASKPNYEGHIPALGTAIRQRPAEVHSCYQVIRTGKKYPG